MPVAENLFIETDAVKNLNTFYQLNLHVSDFNKNGSL